MIQPEHQEWLKRDRKAASDMPFIIMSLPRTGSTSLARILDCHQQIRCLLEPFHPRRYKGGFHALARNELALDSTLHLIWRRWNGVKHVAEATGWPFEFQPALNERVAFRPGRSVILLMRRNLLKRFVSNHISRNTGYWMGTRSGFEERVRHVRFTVIPTHIARQQIRRDRETEARWLELAATAGARVLPLYYEELFRAGRTRTERWRLTNSLLDFLGYQPFPWEEFVSDCDPNFDASIHQWASPEVYRQIPGIQEIEKELGCDETGWLFRK